MARWGLAAAPAAFVLLWSTGFIGARYGLPYAEPSTFLAVRFVVVVAVMAAVVLVSRAPRLTAKEAGHSVVIGLLTHVLYLWGVFTAIRQGVPSGISALIPGLQPLLTSTLASRWFGERVTAAQWCGLTLGLAGVALVLHDRSILGAGTMFGWGASVLSLLGITFGTLYQKRFSGGIDWRSGNLVQYGAALIVFAILSASFDTRPIMWTGEFVFAVLWLALVLSIGAVGLMYWLIRRSAATGFASLFYLVPATTALMAFALFGEKLDTISIGGMVLCAAGVFLVNRAKAV